MRLELIYKRGDNKKKVNINERVKFKKHDFAFS